MILVSGVPVTDYVIVFALADVRNLMASYRYKFIQIGYTVIFFFMGIS